MIVISFMLIILSFGLLENNGKLSAQKFKRWLGISILVVSSALFVIDYGLMRGTFIFLAVMSILGTLFTLLKGKFSSY